MWLIPSACALGETPPVGHKITLKLERGTLLLKAEGEEDEGGGV